MKSMLNCEYENKLARQRSLQESFNGNVKGGLTAEYVPGDFCILEEVLWN